jgi:hypothetical protein
MPITLRANCIGSLAAQVLSRTSAEVVGQVLNTFPNSFYLKTPDDQLIFVTNRTLQSPITINLEWSPSLERAVKPLDQFLVYGKGIQTREVSIDISDASSYHSQPWLAKQLSPDPDRIGAATRIVSFILGIIDTSQSVLDPRGLAHAGVRRFVNDGILCLRQSNMEKQFERIALEIVGLGSGFTPSGDDTLGGFLSMYNSLAHLAARPQILLDSATLHGRTSWISAKLLDYMQRLILDDQIRRVIHSAAEGDESTTVIELESLFPRGHTSGIDISVGEILALSLVRDIVFEKREMEIVTGALGFSSQVV